MAKQKKFMKIYEALKEDILNGQIQYGEQIRLNMIWCNCTSHLERPCVRH